jgi:hypothetical protein
LHTNKLQGKHMKLVFDQQFVSSLRFLISSKAIQPNPHKVKARLDCPSPHLETKLKRFLQSIHFYHKLHFRLFEWAPKNSATFHDIQDLLCSTRFFHLPTFL